MEQLGVSSACYYPLTTEESFYKLCKNGIKCIEVFFNAPSELSQGFISEILKIKTDFGVTIPSVHPLMSFAESFYLFSSYERRFYDILDFYKRFFEIMNLFGSEIFIIHGSKIPGSVSDSEYCERFRKLIDIGKQYNVFVCQENVVDYRSQSIDYIKMMQREIGEDFGMVLDIKQAKRANQDIFEFVKQINKGIKHIHISDHNDTATCLPPGEGNFDFESFFSLLKDQGYNGKYIIELYNHSYSNDIQIYDSFKKISNLLVD